MTSTFSYNSSPPPRPMLPFPTRRSSDLTMKTASVSINNVTDTIGEGLELAANSTAAGAQDVRSEEHTSELQSRGHLVCRLLLEKKKKQKTEREITTVIRDNDGGPRE